MEVAEINRLGAVAGVLGIATDFEGLTVVELGSFADNSANEVGGLLKDGKSGPKTELVFLGDDVAKGVVKGWVGVAAIGVGALGCPGINQLAVAIPIPVMLPKARKILDIYASPRFMLVGG